MAAGPLPAAAQRHCRPAPTNLPPNLGSCAWANLPSFGRCAKHLALSHACPPGPPSSSNGPKGKPIPTLLHSPRAELLALLDGYANAFEWYCFCLACGHSPAQGQETLQALYQAQARWRGSRMGELYPLVCAHWDVLSFVYRMADAGEGPQRLPLQRQLREAKARHRGVVQALRGVWRAD